LSQFIRRGKADSPDLLCKNVWILLDDIQCGFAISSPDSSDSSFPEIVLEQKYGESLKRCLLRICFSYGLGDSLGSHLSDTFDFFQTLGMMKYDIDCVLAEFFGDSFRVYFADATNQIR